MQLRSYLRHTFSTLLTAAGLLLFTAVAAQAQDNAPVTAEAVLEDTTQKVLAVIEEARDYVDEDPERYF